MSKKGIVFSLFTALSVSSFTAVTNWCDTFSGEVTKPLNGCSPTLVLKSVSWSAADVFKANGSVSSDSSVSALLPVKIIPGKVYTLIADLQVVSSDANNNGILFSFSSNLARRELPILGGVAKGSRNCAAMLLRYNGGILTYGEGLDLAAPQVSSRKQSHVLKMILRTQADKNPWSVDYFCNEEKIATYTYKNPPDIRWVGIGPSIVRDGGTLTSKINSMTLIESD